MRRRISIATVVIAVLLAVVTTLLGSFTVLVYRNEEARRLADLQAEAASRADQMAAALGLPLWNLDPVQVRSIVRSGMSDRTVYAIEVEMPEGRIAAGRDPRWAPIELDAVGTADDVIRERRDVLHADEVVGKVRVHVTTRFLAESMAAWRRSSLALIVGLDAVIVLSLALLLWFLLLRPLRSLERYAAAVPGGDAPPAPDQAVFIGELRTLRDSLDHMVAMLAHRVRELQDSEERLKLANRSASIGVWYWDMVNDRAAFDDAMHDIYGLPRGSFAGTYAAWCATVDLPQRQAADANVRAALDSGTLSHEFVIVRPDGARRVISSQGTVQRDERGRPIRMVGVNVDITDRRVAEDEVRTLNAELERRVAERTAQLQRAVDEVVRARDQAESATRSKSDFLANMSHEIRTPLNAVLGMTELALRGELSDKQRGYLTKGKSAGESLLALINDILDFSKIEADKLELEARPFVLQAVLQRVRSVVGLRAREKGLALRCEVAASVPRSLVGDALRLEQVLVNLCSNAVKFTDRGEVSVTVTRLDFDGVLEGSDQAELSFAVRDTGIGMNAEQIGGLFQPFNQLDASTTRKYGGTGLGLAICRRLVGLMGGEIGASSMPGRGSEFRFTATFHLPTPSATAEPMPPAPRDETVAFAVLRGRRVLLVEDNDLNQIVASELLREACGMVVTIAANGPEALARLDDTPFDAVLMDVQMPGMDGYEVARRIRSQADHARLPVIAMTAHAMASDRERCFAAGMNDFVTKPFDPHVLFGVLGKWIADLPAASPGAPVEDDDEGCVSFELGLRRCMGKLPLYEKIVRRHVDASPTVPEEIAAALAEGRRAEAARAAHSLISTAGTLGATALSERARALQGALETGDDGPLPALLAQLAAEHAKVRAALATYLDSLTGAAVAIERVAAKR